MRRLLAILGLVFCLVTVPATAMAAYNPFSGACGAGGGTNNATACDNSVNGGDPIAGPHGILKKVTLFISTIAGVAAVIIVLIGGIQFATSAGDAQKAASARNTIIGGLVGLAIIAVSGGILTFVISKV